MKEEARLQRNQQRLGECFAPFAKRLKAVIRDLEALSLPKFFTFG